MRTRIITVGIIQNTQGQFLLCQMADDHGVYPGQWGLVGGGLEPGETLEEGLTREIREETRLKVESLRPLFFDTDQKNKLLREGGVEEQYLIFLLFEAKVTGEVTLNDEWQAYRWVEMSEVLQLNLNSKTRTTFTRYLAQEKLL